MSSSPSKKWTSERVFVTPEGVDLRLNVGEAGQRAAAFLLDAAIIIAVLIAFTIAAAVMGLGAAGLGVGGRSGFEVVAVIWLLVFFLLRNFYFTAFELSAAAADSSKAVK